MKRSITRWTMAATAAVLLAAPAPGAAQTTGTATPQTQTPTATAASQQAPEAAREHLSKAKAALTEVEAAKLNAKARTQLTEIKKRMTTLERAVGTNDSASATGQANRNAAATANRGNASWGTEVAAIDKALTSLLGPASATGATGTTAPPATGTSGSTTAAAGMTLDDMTRTKLTEVRTHLTAFATAMAGGKTEPTPEPASSTTMSGTSAAPTSATSGTAASGSSTSGGTTQQPPTQSPQTPSATTAPVDESAARQHLTEARNTLSAMTQLPAASQLQGEARTHVTQLITNFNELITTQSEWRASYAKLEANLTAILGPNTETAATGTTTGTAGATGTTGATGATEATAGTSGSGTVAIDAGIREKLVELRRHLNAFEKAAGGSAAGDAANANSTTASSTTTGSTSMSGTATTGSMAGTGSTTAAGVTGTAGTTAPTATEQTAGQTSAGSSADLVKHVAAIDALFKMQDDSGGLTLTKVQVEQLRTHWAALRAAIEKR